MINKSESLQQTNQPSHGSFVSYTAGFILSIILTIIPYFIVVNKLLQGWLLTVAIVELAIIQLLVQLVFFLHLGKEAKPRWNLLMFLATVGIILIVVVGSLWIMYHLNYNMMPEQMESYLIFDEGFEK